MSVSSTRYGIVGCLVAGVILLTGCGGGGSKSNANAPAVPTPSTSDSGAPTDSGAPAPSDSSAPSTKASGGTTYTGPTVGPGHKCGTVSVVAGSIQCSHAEKIYELYATNKQADGKAAFNGWSCLKGTTGVVCSRGAIKLRSAA